MFSVEPWDSGSPAAGPESHFVIAAGAPESNPGALGGYFSERDGVIAADGGLRLLRALDVWPCLLIGDLDTVTPPEVELCREHGVEVERHPADKDQSDLELAIRAAHQRGATRISILGALGGQWDHSLHNLLAPLSLCRQLGLWGRLVTGDTEVYLLWRPSRLSAREGQRVSLAALSHKVEELSLEGFQYPLEGRTLYRHETLGLANRVSGTGSTVRFSSGEILLTLMA